jgi:hypothetical protein
MLRGVGHTERGGRGQLFDAARSLHEQVEQLEAAGDRLCDLGDQLEEALFVGSTYLNSP